MAGMRLGTGLVLAIDIKAQIFPASVTEFKKVAVQGHTTNFTVMDLHSRPFMTQKLITDRSQFE
jgi:hypothetical protein